MKKVFFLLLFCGCASVKSVPPSNRYPQMVGLQEQIKQLKEEELFEEALTEDRQRELSKLQAKVDKYLRLRHGCVHTGMLR